MRGSLAGMRICVLGASGLIGRQVVQELVRAGGRVRGAMRRPNLAGDLRLNGAVGDVQLVQANLRDDASLRRALDGMDAVVSCAGSWREKGPQKYPMLFEMGPERLARLCREVGVQKLVHFSAFAADDGAKSKFLRYKAAGEARIRSVFPEAILLRPNLVFGPDDRLFNRFAYWARWMPILPLLAPANAEFSPIYANDCGVAAMQSLAQESVKGKTFSLLGPQKMTFEQMMRLLLEELDKTRPILPLPRFVLKIKGLMQDALLGPLPIVAPIFGADEVDWLREMAASLKRTKKADPDNSLFSMHELRAVGPVLPTYLWRFREHGEFHEKKMPDPMI